ncbi:hypothetical protein PGQ11_008895 [Apiospora arundinis]|uniref:Uncharacterized protein n=1 Tax=Apiospora arundinis TaxID=335852 RepID=A0ABR2IGF6_9PEZI
MEFRDRWTTGKKNKNDKTKTYNTEDSQVVTDPSTNSALCCLYMGERTGSLVFSRMWSYVIVSSSTAVYIAHQSEISELAYLATS